MIEIRVCVSLFFFAWTHSFLSQLPKYHRNGYLVMKSSDGFFGLPDIQRPEKFDRFDIESLQSATSVEDILPENIDALEVEKKRESMRRQLCFAFDNLYENEIDSIIDSIWGSNDPEVVSIRLKLLELSSLAETIESAALKRGQSSEWTDLGDEIRIIRSQIRMCCDSSFLFKNNPQDNPLRINYISIWVANIQKQMKKLLGKNE